MGRFDRIEITDLVTARHGEIDHRSGAPCDGFERRAQAAAKRAVVSGDPRQIENAAAEMIARISGAAVHITKLVQCLQKIVRGRLAELRLFGNVLQPRGTALLGDDFEDRSRALDGLNESGFRHHAFVGGRYCAPICAPRARTTSPSILNICTPIAPVADTLTA